MQNYQNISVSRLCWKSNLFIKWTRETGPH